MQNITQKLESVYRRIEQQRMRDVPVCNPALQVEAVGFCQCGDYYLGVMVTPWFMNLMLLPVCPEALEDLPEGSKQMHIFPSGRYEFISGKEEDLGPYQVCSLFSPMHEFEDQQIAVETATMVLDEVLQVRNEDLISKKEATGTAANQDRKCETPISRRDFLRGGRSREHCS